MIQLPEKYLDRIYPEPNTGCWLWVGSNSSTGYGQVWFGNRKAQGAHAEIYRRLKGEIPDDYQIDHLCRNPMCVNPDHLEAVTRQENLRRGGLVTRQKRRFCKRGHEFTPENTVFKPDGRKQCHACTLEWKRQFRLRSGLSTSQSPRAVANRLNGIKAAEARRAKRLERIRSNAQRE